MAETEENLKTQFEQIRDERMEHANTATRIGNAFLALLAYISNIADDISRKFLRKDIADVASEVITFAKGLYAKGIARLGGGATFGEYETGATGAAVGSDGAAEFSEARVRGKITGRSLFSTDWIAGLRGFAAYIKQSGKSYFEVDELMVRVKAIFNELEIRKLSYVGGNIELSGAGSTIYKVVPLMNDGETEPYAYRCYFTKDDGTTRTRNWWKVGDMAKCQTFNIEAQAQESTTLVTKDGQLLRDANGLLTAYSKTWENASNRYYWRAVIAVGEATLDDGKTYNYADLANTAEITLLTWVDGEEVPMTYQGMDLVFEDFDLELHPAANDAPMADDEIVQEGSLTDEDRQHIIRLNVVGENAPSIEEYVGVNRYELAPFLKTRIAPRTGDVFVARRFEIMTEGGGSYRVPCDRGEYTDGMAYNYYDRVSYQGSLWLCVNKGGNAKTADGVTQRVAPSADEPDYWQQQVGKGDSAVRIDLDNENDTMLYDGSGNLVSGSVTSTGRLLEGMTDVSGMAEWSIAPHQCTAAFDSTTRTVTVTAMSADTGYVAVSAIYKGVTYTALLTLKRLVGTDKFELRLSESIITYNQNTGSRSAASIKINVYRTAQNGTRTLVDSLPMGMALSVSCDNQVCVGLQYADGEAVLDIELYQNQPKYKTYYVYLWNLAGNIVLDSETVPVVWDGIDGENALNVVLSPETVILTQSPADSSIPLDNAKTEVRVYDGTEDVTAKATVSVSTDGSCTAAAVGNSVSITGLTGKPETGKVYVTVRYAGLTATRVLAYAVNYLGEFKETIENDVKRQVASKTFYYIGEDGEIKTSQGLSEIVQNAEVISGRVEKVEGGVKDAMSEITQQADRITLGVYTQDCLNYAEGGSVSIAAGASAEIAISDSFAVGTGGEVELAFGVDVGTGNNGSVKFDVIMDDEVFDPFIYLLGNGRTSFLETRTYRITGNIGAGKSSIRVRNNTSNGIVVTVSLTKRESLKDSLEKTGIDIGNRTITATTDKFTVKGSDGTTYAVFELDPETGLPTLKADYVKVSSLLIAKAIMAGGINIGDKFVVTIGSDGQANVRVSGALDGAMGSFSGYLKKTKTVITKDNILDYLEEEVVRGAYTLNVEKCGTFVEFSGDFDYETLGVSSLLLYMPSIYPDTDYGEETDKLDEARGYIGNTIILVCKSSSGFGVSGRCCPPGSTSPVSLSVSPGKFISLTCKCRSTNGLEDVYWEYYLGDYAG